MAPKWIASGAACGVVTTSSQQWVQKSPAATRVQAVHTTARSTSSASSSSDPKRQAKLFPQDKAWRRAVDFEPDGITVNMSGKGVGDDDMQLWCKWFGLRLQERRKAGGALLIDELDFSRNELTAVGAEALLEAVADCQVLVLKLFQNVIERVGGIGSLLRAGLRELHVSHNELGTDAAAALAVAVVEATDAETGAPRYPLLAASPGGNAVPLWMRLERNYVDQAALVERVEAASRRLNRSSPPLCYAFDKACTLQCCSQQATMHIKYLKSQRPLPEQALEANCSAPEATRPMPRGKNGDRKPAASEATWKPVEKSREKKVAGPDALPTLLQSTERAERESEDSGKAKVKVWKVKEVSVAHNNQSDSNESQRDSDHVFPAKGGKAWKVKVVDTQRNSSEIRSKEKESSPKAKGNLVRPDMESQPGQEGLSRSSSGSTAPLLPVDSQPYDRRALLFVLRRLRKEDALDDKCLPPPWRAVRVGDAAPPAPVLSPPLASKPESPVLRASAAEFVPTAMLTLPEADVCALPRAFSPPFMVPQAVRAAAQPVPSGRLTVRDLALRFQSARSLSSAPPIEVSTAEVLECARPGTKTSKSNKISAQYLSTS